MRRLLLALVCLGLLLALAGCGGGDDEASGEDTSAEVTETLTQPADDDGATDDLDTSGLDGLASDECLQLVSIGAAIAQAFSGAGGDTGETSELLARLADEVPDEIRADIETLAAGYSEYADAVRDLDLEAGQTPSGDQLQQIQAAIASIDQPGLQAASERVSAWAETNC